MLVIISWVIVASATVAMALVGLGDGNVFGRTSTGIPLVSGSDSAFVINNLVDDQNGETLFVELRDVDPADADLIGAVQQVADAVAADPDVESVTTPFGIVPTVGAAPPLDHVGDAVLGDAMFSSPLVSTDGDAIVVMATFAPDAEPTVDHLTTVADTIADAVPDATPIVYAATLMYHDFEYLIQRDLVVGEAIALPAALLVMVLVFGGFLAASAPVIGAIASIASGMGVLFGFTYVLDLDQSAINVVTVLGIGLSIDYGLLLVSRFREELLRRSHAGASATHREVSGAPESLSDDDRIEALVVTVSTAGRTVFYSAVIIAISVGGMLVFDAEIIRGIGGASLGVVVMALLTALTLVPAVLHLYGPVLARPSVLDRLPGIRRVLRATSDVTRDHGVFSRLATWVQRRPWTVLIVTTGLLLFLASPLLNVQLRNSSAEMLPAENSGRIFVTEMEARYPDLAAPHQTVMAATTAAELDAWLADVADDEVWPVAPAAQQGEFAVAQLRTTHADQSSPEAVAVVRDLRQLSEADAAFPVYLGGTAAIQADFMDALVEGAPWAIGIVVIATFVLMFLMTGSVLVPLKTLIINALSLLAALGVLAWIFSDGNLEGLLGFTSAGGVETYVLVMILAFGFGLAMDYEVFLIARIKELIDAGHDNDTAVRIGLQRSGRIITSAALVIVLVFLGFAAGQLLVIKQVGVGLAVAVALDATIVRMLLVPATMTLLGNWNWWAPAPLRRVYQRLSLEH